MSCEPVPLGQLDVLQPDRRARTHDHRRCRSAAARRPSRASGPGRAVTVPSACADRRDLRDRADSRAAQAHVVAVDESGRVRDLDLDVVGRDERQARSSRCTRGRRRRSRRASSRRRSAPGSPRSRCFRAAASSAEEVVEEGLDVAGLAPSRRALLDDFLSPGSSAFGSLIAVDDALAGAAATGSDWPEAGALAIEAGSRARRRRDGAVVLVEVRRAVEAVDASRTSGRCRARAVRGRSDRTGRRRSIEPAKRKMNESRFWIPPSWRSERQRRAEVLRQRDGALAERPEVLDERQRLLKVRPDRLRRVAERGDSRRRARR